MKVLLLGDYSNVHATLAEGLRALGHSVVVASDGDGWKNYPRDIDITRRGNAASHSLLQRLRDVSYYLRLRWLFATRFKGFDVVQLINPVFLDLRAERIMPFYRALRKNNGKIFVAAYGMDHYWVKAGLDCTTFEYSDFNLGDTVRHDLPENELFIRDWLDGPKGKLHEAMAQDCDGIPAGLYEYWLGYDRHLPPSWRHKLTYIPFPIKIEDSQAVEPSSATTSVASTEGTEVPVRFFIGIQKSRSAYKGTDIMLRALQRLKADYPERVSIQIAENVPFAEYKRMMNSSDVILDQLYGYTPAMNALQAMSQGLVVVGGAEDEFYEMQQCGNLRPVLNVKPNEESVYEQLRWIVEHREELPRLKQESVEFVKRWHDHRLVAQQYVDFWSASLHS